MRVLVSGGSGLVGRYIVNGLQEAGMDVVVGGRSAAPPNWFSKPAPFMPLSLDPDLDQQGAFSGIDAFVHAAFDHLPGKYRGGEGGDPDRFRRLNFDGSIRLFQEAKAAGARRAVFLSSRAVYDGSAPGVPLTEDMPLRPTTLYGQIKLETEAALTRLSTSDFIAASLRLTGVYGHLRPNKWDDLFADYLAGRKIRSRAGSEVHGKDVAAAVRLVLGTERNTSIGQVFNVSDIAVDRRAILAEVKRVLAVHHPLPPEARIEELVRMSTDRLRSLGWQPGGHSLLVHTIEAVASGYL